MRHVKRSRLAAVGLLAAALSGCTGLVVGADEEPAQAPDGAQRPTPPAPGVDGGSSSAIPRPPGTDAGAGPDSLREPPGGDPPASSGGPLACDSDKAVGLMPSRVIRLSYTQYNRTIRSLFSPLPRPPKPDPRGPEAPAVPDFPMPFEDLVDSERSRSLDFVLTLNAAESEAVLEASEALAAGLQERLLLKMPCLKTWDDPACLGEAFKLVGRALYRRPLGQADLDALLAVYNDGRKFLPAKEAGKAVFISMFGSPKFLFRTEIGDVRGALTPFELADAVGYGLTDGPPDEPLVEAATAGTLVQKEELRRQIDRLFKEKKVSTRMISFVRELLGYDAFEVRDKPVLDHTLANFGTRGRTGTRASADLFVSSLLEDSPVQFPTRLMSSTRVWVNAPSDELFGMFDKLSYSTPCPPVPGSIRALETGSYCSYEFDGKTLSRRGILTHPAFLGAFATDKATEFIRRARFLRERLLCAPVPQAPADLADEIAAGMNLSEDLAATARDRFKAHAENPKCSGCHVQMDPFAIPLEGYDIYGRTRTTERVQGKSLTIDTKTPLVIDPSKPPVTVANAMEMSEQIAASPLYQDCFLARLYSTIVAREDGCRAREGIAHYRRNGEDLTAFAKWLYTDDRFLTRKR